MVNRLLLRLLPGLWMLFLLGEVRAQTSDFPHAKHLAHFPFKQFSGGIIVIQGTMNDDPDSLNFILDTGSGGISIDSVTALRMKLPITPSERIIRGIAGTRKLSFAQRQTLHLPGLTVENMDFHINDYEILTEVYGVKIDGIIGYSFLRQQVVAIDYDSMCIDIYTPGVYNYPKGGYLMKPRFTTLPITNLRVKDDHKAEADFYFDTGAGLCFLLSEQFVKDSMILKRRRKPVMTQAEGLGGKTAMRLSVVKEVRVGPFAFKDVPTYILDDQNNVTAYPSLGGLIGNDLLRRFNLVINYPFREIHLIPNSHYRESFDYSYTGLGIYYIGGRIMVTDVQKESPAEKAGVLPGDELFGVDNNFSHNIQIYKTMLQSSDSRLRLLLFRNGAPHMTVIRIKSIL